MHAAGRILVSGGHEFSRRHPGNDALCDLIVDLADSSRPRICLLPTASGDPQDQIASFRRSFGERDCEPSSVSLFRLGTERVDLRRHLLAQDVIYVGGGSMVNLVAIWKAHALGALLREAAAEGILICGQSAGAMCWFEQGVTCSSGIPAAAEGLGLLPGSACVHYLSEPERRAFYLRAVESGEMQPGLAMSDQSAALFEDGRLIETIVARDGAEVRRVSPGGEDGKASEETLGSRRIEDRRPSAESLSGDVLELRETLAARSASARLGRRSVARLD
jgi:peptidase E